MASKAFVAALRDNPEVIQQVSSLECAQKVLAQLFMEEMSPAEILKRTRHYEFGDALLRQAISMFQQVDRWTECIRAVRAVAEVNIREDFWDRAVVEGLLSDWFIHTVRWYIVRGDWLRAWDELGRGRRGWESPAPGGNPGRFAIHQETLLRLAYELYLAMYDKRVLLGGFYPVPQTQENVDLVGSTARPPEDRRRDAIFGLAEHFHKVRSAARRRRTARKVAGRS